MVVIEKDWERCGECRLFRESTQRYMDSAVCIKAKRDVEERTPACAHFVPMPKHRRKLWG